jgi:hypothetical protein
MRLTEETINDAFAIEWFCKFDTLLKIFLKNSEGIFGGVVRDYILPCKSSLLDIHKFNSLKSIIKKNKYFEFHDFDVLVKDEEQIEIIKNCIEKSEIGTFCYKYICNDEEKEIHSYQQFVMMIEVKDWCTENYDYNFQIDFVIKHKCVSMSDFNVNNIIYSKNGYSILDNSHYFRHWVLNNEERLKQQSNNINYFNWYSPMMIDVCVQLVEKSIEKKEAYFIGFYTPNLVNFDKITYRFNKLMNREYTFIELYECNNISYSIDFDDKCDRDICSICHDSMRDDNIKIRSKCCGDKNRFHLSCIWKWVQHANRPSCPLCRTTWKWV